MSSYINLHDFPISMAVSYLSPVNTHILISASISLAIVSGTPSYSLSSMALLPTYVNPVSI